MFSRGPGDKPSFRGSRIQKGQQILGAKSPVTLGSLQQGDVIQFAYQAQTPGFPPETNLVADHRIYDATPHIVLFDLQSRKGLTYLQGCNVNYFEKQVDRTKVVLTLRANLRFNKRLFGRMIHQYRLDRIKSPLYKDIDVTTDALILDTIATWKRL